MIIGGRGGDVRINNLFTKSSFSHIVGLRKEKDTRGAILSKNIKSKMKIRRKRKERRGEW